MFVNTQHNKFTCGKQSTDFIDYWYVHTVHSAL